MTFAVRPVTAEEWRRVRDLRLQALADEVAPIAFLDTVADASTRPDAFWQQRAANATGGGTAVQLIAETDAGEWAGSVTVLAEKEAGLVVGVYIATAHRGRGMIDALLDEAAAWAGARGLTALDLGVHVDNQRAQAVYARCGFVRVGETVAEGFGREWIMRRELVAEGSVHA